MKIQLFFGRLFEIICLLCFALALFGRTEYMLLGIMMGFLGMVVLDQAYWENEEEFNKKLNTQHNDED